jgi:hypothetical protein
VLSDEGRDISGHRKLLLALLATRNSSGCLIGRRSEKTGKTKEKSEAQQNHSGLYEKNESYRRDTGFNLHLLACKPF